MELIEIKLLGWAEFYILTFSFNDYHNKKDNPQVYIRDEWSGSKIILLNLAVF